MGESIQTSRGANIPRRFGVFRWVNVAISGVLVLPIFLASTIIRDSYPIASLIFGFGGSPAVLAFLEWIYGGRRYPWDRLDRIASRASNLLGLTITLDGNDPQVGGRKMGSRPDAMYNYDGDEIYGFVLEARDETDFERTFRTCIMSLLQELPDGCALQVLKPSVPLKDETIARERPILIERRVRQSSYYLFIRISPTAPEVSLRRERLMKAALSLSTEKKAMTCEDISRLSEWIVSPRSPGTGRKLPFYPLSLRLGDAVARGYSADLCHAAASLAALPHAVDSDFEQVFRPVFSCEGVVSVTFEARPAKSIVRRGASSLLIARRNAKDTSATAELTTDEQVEIEKDKGNTLNVTMNVTCLVFGERERVDRALLELESEASSGDSSQRCVFAREGAYLKQAITACLPGGRARIPFRRQIVIRADEAAMYVPLPTRAAEVKPNGLLLRSEDNMASPVDLSEEYPMLLIGPPGSGKSTMLSLFIEVWLRRWVRGEAVAGFFMEAGASFAYLTEGILDSYIRLRKDPSKQKEYEPIDIWPLAAFFSFGLEGRRYATNWICDVMIIDETNRPRDHALVERAVGNCFDDGKTRLFQLAEVFDALVREEAPVAGTPRHDELSNACARLRSISKGSRLGEYFDPDTTRLAKLDDVNFLYCVKSESDTSDETCLRIWSQMCYGLRNLFLSKFEAGGSESCAFLTIIDELEYWRSSLGVKILTVVANQDRKRGGIFVVASQKAEHLILEDEDQDRKYALMTGFRRKFISGMPEADHLWKLLGATPGSDPAHFLAVTKILKKMKTQKVLFGEYSWCYVSEGDTAQRLIVDVDREELWRSTTRGGGRTLRRAALRLYTESGGRAVAKPLTPRVAYFEVCRLLARAFGDEIPESDKLSRTYVIGTLQRVFGVQEVPNDVFT